MRNFERYARAGMPSVQLAQVYFLIYPNPPILTNGWKCGGKRGGEPFDFERRDRKPR